MTLKLYTEFVLVLNIHGLLFLSFCSFNGVPCSKRVFFT